MAARKAKHVFRGARSQVLNKLLRAIELIDSMDFREAERSTLDNRSGDYFIADTDIRIAVDRVRNQAAELKALKR